MRPDDQLFPIFLKLSERPVLVVGGGVVASSKLEALLGTGARVTVVAPEISESIRRAPVTIRERPFEPSDLDGQWLVVAAAPPEVNRLVAEHAHARNLFVNAVDDPANASAYLGGVVRRDGVTIAISTNGRAPAIAGLLREGLDALLPIDLDRWFARNDEMKRVWRATGVPMDARRPQLLDAINALYEKRAHGGAGFGGADRLRPDFALRASSRSRHSASRGGGQGYGESAEAFAKAEIPSYEGARGLVSVVGAGPGDPDLLTLRAIRCLKSADVVLHDGLVPDAVVELATTAEHVSVARRTGAKDLSHADVIDMMIDRAREGRRVVRLKAGDPFVLGRGGEEVQALAHAGVPFEIVPGLTSAIAAPALAGIPVTHRGLSSGFLVVSGHASSAYAPILATLAPESVTVIVLMGLAERGGIRETLVAAGWSPETPAAIVTNASQPDQHVWTGTLDALETGRDFSPLDEAGVIVIGPVVSLAIAASRSVSYVSEEISWLPTTTPRL